MKLIWKMKNTKNKNSAHLVIIYHFGLVNLPDLLHI